ncbi:MAG: efflux RND transporter periplasmic adaptor subunit [Spongiibacteraceae bacterium]
MKNLNVPSHPIALALLLAFSLLGGCGDKSKSAQPAESSEKEAGHHDGDHAEAEGGKDKHAAGKHDESEHNQGEHEGGAKEEKVSLTEEQIKTADIEFAQSGPVAIRETLPLYGVIAPNAERMRDVAARYAGAIRRVDKKIGDAVKQGETLAIVESNESLQAYSVTAPLTGIITVRNANVGEQTTEKPLFTVTDLSTVWVELSLFPRDVAKVRVGQTARVKSTEAGLSADGVIAYVAPFGSSTNQTVMARVVLANPEHRWAPGLYVTADVALSQQSVAIAVRNDAIQTLEGKTSVFVEHDDGFEPRAVRLGKSDGEYSEVLEGLEAGQRYATRNSFVLKAELKKGEASHDD